MRSRLLLVHTSIQPIHRGDSDAPGHLNDTVSLPDRLASMTRPAA
jgi:hypothetical protein